ncbi:MAG: carbohydrate kinase family protein [Candidatus Thorarchaeota archaeon]
MRSSRHQNEIPLVACLGEVLIDFIAEHSGPLNSISSFRKLPGGAPANVAVGIARLGIACGFIGKISSDAFGAFLFKTLEQNGVWIDGIIRTTEAPTALAFVNRTDTGDREFLFYRDTCADILLTEDDLPIEWLQNIKFLHVGGVSLTRNPSRRATIKAAALASQHGATVTFDPNIRLDLWNNDIEECRLVLNQVLTNTDIFLPSQEELLLLTGKENLEEAVEDVHRIGPRIICVKQGAKGSFISSQQSLSKYHQFNQAAFNVDVVDTTGAGDGFDAGLIVGLVTGLSLSEAVLNATAVASLVISKLGAMTALPSKKELDLFHQKFTN